MQHFASFHLSQANFIRLSDKNINQARKIMKEANSNNPQSFTRLSGFDPNKSLGANINHHDNIQHGLVTKDLYKVATGTNPNQYFRDGSLAQKSSVMPIVQNRQLSPEKRNMINQTTEGIVRAVADPANMYSSGLGRNPLNFKAIKAYSKKANTDSERLAARPVTTTLITPDPYKPSQYFPEEKDNQKFKKYYIDKMRKNDREKVHLENSVRSSFEKENRIGIRGTIKNKVSNMLGKSTAAGDSLRNKLKQRESYSEQFTKPNSLERDAALKYYETTGLMPR
jgi:hypothetical protein